MRTLTGHSHGVWSVAFSLDSKHIVSGSTDKLVKIWKAETGAEVNRFVRERSGLRGHGDYMLGVRAYRVGSGLRRVGWQVRTLHSGGVLSVAFSPDGTRVVSGSLDELVKIWDTATAAEVRSVVGVR